MEVDRTMKTNPRPKSMIAVVVPAAMMAFVAVSLAVWQWRSQPQEPLVKPVATIVKKTEVKPVETPVVAEEQVVEPEFKPAVSPETLDSKRKSLTRLVSSVKPAQSQVQARAQDLKSTWTTLQETSLKVHSTTLSAETALTEAQAEDAKLKALAKRQQELAKEFKQLANAPKPPREGLSGFSPVAKPAKGNEYHFEVRDGRVAFIDLEKLMELVKKDFQVRMRLSGSPRGIRSEVGPVGEYGLAYEIGPANDLLSGSTGFGMKGWEVVPARDPRGETVEQAMQGLSEFQRSIKRLSPREATITMWVYPSGFTAFRQMRDQLHTQGFMVAARPLPEGVPVRGSPTGSLSAGQ